MLKKKKLNFKQWAEEDKLDYRRGGDISSPVVANTNATSEYEQPERWLDDSAASGQRTAGSVISAVGGVASAINPLIGAAIGAIGGIVSGTAMPTVRENRLKNTNPYGYKLGGKMFDPIKGFTFVPGGISESDSFVDSQTAAEDKKKRVASIQSDKDFYENEVRKEGYDPKKIVPMGVRPMVDPEASKDPYNNVRQYFNTLAKEDQEKKYNRPKYANGGDLDKLSEDAVQVKADNPSLTDSVETDKVNLDHNEVVTNNKVFSDSIMNPSSGRTFAKDEEINQKLLGKFQKLRNKSGDAEFKDEQYLQRNSEDLFKEQERVATEMGLRNPDGSPVQDMGMKFGGMFKKGKMGYYGGGPIKDPYAIYGQEINPGISTGDFKSSAGLFGGIEGTSNSPWSGRTFYYQNKYGAPLTESPETIKNDLEMNSQSTTNIDPVKNPIKGLLDNIAQQNRTTLGTFQPESNSYRNLTNYSGGVDVNDVKSVTENQTSGVGTIPVSGPPNPDASLDTSTDDKLKTKMPWGLAGTSVGLASNIFNRLNNTPTFVNYKNIGHQEKSMQDKAIQALVRGESNAINDATMEGKVARENLSARSLQSRNANLRNIATGIAKAKAGVRDSFATRMAGSLSQFGQRRSAIEEANRMKDMQVDVINTQESDAVRTEGMRMDDNVRQLLIEQQLAQNNNRKNTMLERLLQTKNFKFDPNSEEGIQFIQSIVSDGETETKSKKKVKYK